VLLHSRLERITSHRRTPTGYLAALVLSVVGEVSRLCTVLQLLQVETQLTEERMRRVEVERTAEKEREARGKEVLMHRELIGTLKEQVAELRETNLRTAQERHAAMEEEAAARGSMHAAILEKQRTEEELRLLVDRCEAAESEREQLRRRVDRLQYVPVRFRMQTLPWWRAS
jgi:chromosome segregation ATPase